MKVDLKKAIHEVAALVIETNEKTVKKHLFFVDSPCRKDCDSCCKNFVSVTLSEALVIQMRLEKEKRWEEVKKKCLDLLVYSKNSNPLTWFYMSIECPLLKEHGCSVYSVRPIQCSTHFVSSKKEQCDPNSTDPGVYAPRTLQSEREAFVEGLNKLTKGGLLSARIHLVQALLLAEKVRVNDVKDLDDLVSVVKRISLDAV